MVGKLVTALTKDNIWLQGLFCEPKKKTNEAFLHIHGLQGNFYENYFIDPLVVEANKRGVSLLTVNQHGSGYRQDYWLKDFSDTKMFGGNYELFEDCILDIDAWLKFLKSQGYTRVFLQGHSLGTLKVVYYQTKTKNPLVKTLILLSPADMAGLWKDGVGDNTSSFLRLAKNYVSKRQGDRLMPAKAAGYPVSAKTYYNFYGPKARTHIFDFHNPDFDYKLLKKVSVPTLAILGDKDNYTKEGKAGEYLELMKENMKDCEIKLFKDSDHWYTGNEEKLAKFLVGWLGDKFNCN